MFTHRELLRFLALIGPFIAMTASLPLWAQTGGTQDRPNVVVMMADNVG